MRLTDKLIDWLVDQKHCTADATASTYKSKTAALVLSGELTGDKFAELSTTEDDIKADRLRHKGNKMSKADALFAGRNGTQITVKGAGSQYNATKSAVKNRLGHDLIDPTTQRQCMTQSELEKAQAGVMFKHLANRCGVTNNPLSEHERELLDQLAIESDWCGKMAGEFIDHVQGSKGIKALIDDSLSGGLEITPISFDDNVITFPLLNGELFPYVDLQPVPRGRRIEGASIQSPTMSWGGGDTQDINLFTTTAMVSALDTTIMVVDGCIEIGRDFLSDSPINVGNVLTGLVGERLQAELDKKVANGNGTTEPEGIFTASGLTTISVDHSGTGPMTLNDLYSLFFSVGKQYRTAANNLCFISNDLVYQRSRAVKIDANSPSTDQRPVLDPMNNQFGGSLVNSYSALGFPWRVQNDIANAKCAIVALKKYRMYRRLGLDMRFETAGKTLARANTVLLIFRARFGGRIMDANAAAKWTSGQT